MKGMILSRAIGAIVLLAMLMAVPADALAAAPTFAQLDPGFNNGQPLQLPGSQIMFSSPTLADLTGDGKLEIIVGGDDGRVYAIRSDGSLLWSYQVADAINPHVANPTSTSVIRGAPSVGDLNGDGTMEVVIGVGTVGSAQLYGRSDVNGGLVVLNHKGKLVDGWPYITYDQVGNDYDGYTDAIAVAPALGDLDGDGTLEIVATSFDMRIYAWHHDGTLVKGWPKFIRETPWSPVALADLNNDGSLEVIALIATHYDPHFNKIDGGQLQVYSANGNLLCSYTIDQGFTSAPAIGDLNGDGSLEIVAGTGDWYQGVGRGWKVYAWNGNCQVRPGWPRPTNGYMRSAPALADLNGDGSLEVIATSGTINWGSLDRRIYAWHHNGTSVSGFPTIARDFFDSQSYPLSPIVADWTGDGRPEIFTSLAWEVAGVRADGSQFTYYGWPNGPAGQKTYWGNYQLSNDPAIGDIDGDGRLELVIASVAKEGDTSRGGILVYQSPASGGSTPWPMLGGNAQHTYVYSNGSTAAHDARIVNHTIPDLMFPGIAYEVEITVENTGAETWTYDSGYQLLAYADTIRMLSATGVPLSAAAQIRPGERETFTFRMYAPATQGYYTTGWRMSIAGQPFGTRLQHQVKVGNDPALYVLARDKSLSPDGSGIYAVGMAQPIPAPLDTAYMWSRAMDFGLLPDGSAYHVICDAGYTTWSAHAPVLGVLPYSSSSAWKSISMLPDGTGFYALDRDGRIQRTDGAEPLAIANLPAGQMQDIAVTPDGRGLMAMDRRGRVYSAGTAPVLALPSPLPFPENQAIARSLEMTADGRGYYILDNYGRLWAAGTAQALTANYEVHLGEDWARDFAVTENGEGYYMLDKYGNIHTGGDAPDITINLPPTWTDAQALSLKLLDSRSSDQPRLVTSQTSVSFVTVPGAASQSLSIELLSDCGQDLTWSVSLSPSVPWLTVFQSGSRTPSSLLLMVSGDLQVGTYSTTLVFSAVDGEGNPVQTQEVPVTVRVWERVHTVQLPLILSQR